MNDGNGNEQAVDSWPTFSRSLKERGFNDMIGSLNGYSASLLTSVGRSMLPHCDLLQPNNQKFDSIPIHDAFEVAADVGIGKSVELNLIDRLQDRVLDIHFELMTEGRYEHENPRLDGLVANSAIFSLQSARWVSEVSKKSDSSISAKRAIASTRKSIELHLYGCNRIGKFENCYDRLIQFVESRLNKATVGMLGAAVPLEDLRCLEQSMAEVFDVPKDVSTSDVMTVEEILNEDAQLSNLQRIKLILDAQHFANTDKDSLPSKEEALDADSLILQVSNRNEIGNAARAPQAVDQLSHSQNNVTKEHRWAQQQLTWQYNRAVLSSFFCGTIASAIGNGNAKAFASGLVIGAAAYTVGHFVKKGVGTDETKVAPSLPPDDFSFSQFLPN